MRPPSQITYNLPLGSLGPPFPHGLDSRSGLSFHVHDENVNWMLDVLGARFLHCPYSTATQSRPQYERYMGAEHALFDERNNNLVAPPRRGRGGKYLYLMMSCMYCQSDGRPSFLSFYYPRVDFLVWKLHTQSEVEKNQLQ